MSDHTADLQVLPTLGRLALIPELQVITMMMTFLSAHQTPLAMTMRMMTFLSDRHESLAGNMILMMMPIPTYQAILALTQVAALVIPITSILGLKA